MALVFQVAVARLSPLKLLQPFLTGSLYCCCLPVTAYRGGLPQQPVPLPHPRCRRAEVAARIAQPGESDVHCGGLS